MSSKQSADKLAASSSSERQTCNDATNRPLRIGVPEQASDGQQDASQVGAIYMAAKKKTAKKSTKKKTAKKGKK